MMTKKIILTIWVLATSISTAFAGNWRIHPTFAGNEIQNIVDTKDKVYYLVSHNLYRYDKETQENEALNKVNYLNDVNITNIYFNDLKEYLLITYSNANVDIITKEGKVINMPDIKSAMMIGTKYINDVTFNDNGKAYIATNFGYVVINDNKWEVIESRNFKQEIASVAVMGNHIFLSKDNSIYYGDKGRHYETLESFNKWDSNDNGHIFPINDSTFLLLTGWTFCNTFTENSDGSLNFQNSDFWKLSTDNIHKTPSGFLGNSLKGNLYYTIDQEGKNFKSTSCSNELFCSYASGDGTLWSINQKGMHNDKDSATYHKPDATTISLPFYLTYNDNQKLLYASSTGTNQLIDIQNYPTTINTYNQNSWTDITPQPAIEGGGTYNPLFVPNDPKTYILSSWWNGIYKVTDGQVVYNYYWENSPLKKINNYYCHTSIAFDREGNLWAVQTGRNPGDNVFVLPKAKLAQKSSQSSDWITVNIPDLKGNKRNHLLFPKKSNVNIYSNGDYKESLIFFANGDALSSSVSSKLYPRSSLLDQDETQFDWEYITTLTEDNNGSVWMGTDRGVIAFDPSKALQNDFRINHIKVPRNDGTNLADYLLDGIHVNCIAVDGGNRKWIGTNGSGLFLVSADGSQVLEQFNTGNSPLLSDNIYQVCCDPNSNSVYITTPHGLMEYFSNSTPAQNDYSNVYAYPNPVTPDYGGLITIIGLMDNSLVKISDTAGNIVKQVKSTGGMATWDGCNSNGERVKSGVYFIIASQSETTGSESVVSKILIMR